MPNYEMLISKGKYREAAALLDAELAKREDARLYYLRAMVSHKLGNYDYAHQMLEHALHLKKEPEYFKLKGLMLMETLDFEAALGAFMKVLEKKTDAETYFLCSACMMFLDNPKSKECLRLAYHADPQKTKMLIREFYEVFFRNSPFLTEKEKKALADKIASVK